MCNLYHLRSPKQNVIDLVRAMRDQTGNFPVLPGIFPDKMAPIVRNTPENQRELLSARWGFAPPTFPGQKSARPVTNIRNTTSRHWTPWLKKVEHRCLVPVNSFCEPDNRAGDDKPSVWTWFAIDETRPLFFFAGIWREWEGTRGTKAEPVTGRHILYSFLTTDPSPDVRDVHPDASPVLLLNEHDRELWMHGEWEEAKALQRPAPAGSVKVVLTGTKQDTA